jgi:hypothetical protein
MSNRFGASSVYPSGPGSVPTPPRLDPDEWEDPMEVATRLGLFAAALVVALVAGWGLGRAVGPLPDAATPAPLPAVDVHGHSPSPDLFPEQP